MIYEDDPKEVKSISQSPKPWSSTDDAGPSGVVYSRPPCLSSSIPSKYEDEVKVDHPEIYVDTSSTSTPGGFYQLKKFHFVGGLPLIQDLIPCITSGTLEDISITVIRLSAEDLRQEYAESMRRAEAEERRRIAEEEIRRRVEAMETRIRSMDSEKRNSKARNLKIARRRQEILEDVEMWAQRPEALTSTEWMQKCPNPFDLQTASYISVLQKVSSRWSASLKAVNFSQSNQSSQPLSNLPALPKEVYKNLFCHPKIEKLEFKGWKLDSIEDLLFSLKSSTCSKNLKQLHLPVDDPDPTISISLPGLRDIAETCPMLESLQCCINTLAPIPRYSIPTGKALSHGLKTLLVNNNEPSPWDFNQLLLVARHLYLVFPQLQIIHNVEGPLNSGDWERIRDLVKMFQTIREDDMYRS